MNEPGIHSIRFADNANMADVGPVPAAMRRKLAGGGGQGPELFST